MPNPTPRRRLSWQRPLLHALAFVLVAGLVAGCGIFSPDENTDGGTPPPKTTYPLATSETQLIKNFQAVYNNRDYDEYDNLLAENFQFWFAPDDVDAIGQGDFWDRQQDAQSTRNMFNGATGQRPDGSTVPAVQSINLQLSQVEAWSNAGGEVVGGQTTLPDNARKARYSVSMSVYYTDDSIVSQINGEQLFYVIPVPTDQEGVDEWKLVLWRDFGNTQ
jgi:hypothetical protein